MHLSSVTLARESGVVLTAYRTFDEGYSSVANNEHYEGLPKAGEFTSITNQEGFYLRGTGALKLDSCPHSDNGTYMDIENEVFPDDHDALSIVGWHRYADISGDG